MKRNPFVLIAFALLPALSTAAPPSRAGWTTYRSEDFGFSIRYPASFTFYSGHPDIQQTRLSMFPVCEDTTVACFEYNRGDNKNSDLQAAGLSVNVLRDRKSQHACIQSDEHSRSLKPRLIHGIPFSTGETGSAGMGSSSGGDIYHTFRQGVCFEIAVMEAVTDAWIVEDSGPRFPAAKMRRIDNELDTMLQSFAFTGPVADGAAWDGFSESGCGSSFEYPSGDAVQQDIPYDADSYRTDKISCSEHFAHLDRNYTVTVKTSIGGATPDDERANDWLQSFGYKPLNGSQQLVKTENCSEYRAEPYFYFSCSNTIAILGMSDAAHYPIPPGNDPVFAHMLRSFQLQ
jgi:hypothetical protein